MLQETRYEINRDAELVVHHRNDGKGMAIFTVEIQHGIVAEAAASIEQVQVIALAALKIADTEYLKIETIAINHVNFLLIPIVEVLSAIAIERCHCSFDEKEEVEDMVDLMKLADILDIENKISELKYGK